MTNRKTTKKALLSSAISLMLCLTMLIGTTFAWFTDSVTSASNIIKSGNLDVDVYYGNVADEKSIEDVSTLFNDVTLWEPGAVAYENLTVVNKGTLALKYLMTVAFTNENKVVNGEYGLSQILKVGLVEDGIADGLTRDEVLSKVNEWKPMKDFEIERDELKANTNDKTVGLVIYWEPSAEDNNYNVNNGKVTSDGQKYLHIDLGIKLLATQLASEEDSFDETYDEDAEYPVVVNKGANEQQKLQSKGVTVTVPEQAEAGKYELKVDAKDKVYQSNADNYVASYDINLYKDGAKVTGTSQVDYPVEIKLAPLLNIEKVTHNEVEYNKNQYSYNPLDEEGILSFETNSFSPFSVTYEEMCIEGEIKDGQIVHGTFDNVNPADIDTTLNTSESPYISTSFVKGGKTYYRISEKATTIFLEPTGTEIVKSHGAIESEGKFYLYFTSEVAGCKLTPDVFYTVYLLPGEYQVETRANVTNSMDIIGLGDKEDIKVTKLSSSNSNQHLFNCSGTRSEYIEVTINNMTLDATVKTTKGKDNGAVQSIRKSKVKCYNLDIIKGNNFGDIVFYVNGNNAVDGVKYPAYMYVENCTLNTSRPFNILTTQPSYKFYHSGLMYNNGSTEYSSNSGSTLNQVMEWNDWEW